MTPAAAIKAIETMPPLDAATAGQQIAAILASVQGNANVNRDEVNAIITARFSGLIDTVQDMLSNANKPLSVQVTNNVTGAVVDCGTVHRLFPELLKRLQARGPNGSRLNHWVWGPAGTGKTTAAAKAAEALGLPFHTNGALDTQYELCGFIDGHGVYQETAFYRAFSGGGLYLYDDIGGSNPRVLKQFAAALANGFYTFPGKGLVKRHPDCIIVAGANTNGRGGNSQYNTEAKMDDSSLDRFVFLEWPIDENLERAVACNDSWVNKVQSVRNAVKDRGIRGCLITPRASIDGAALLAVGVSESDVIDATLRKGLSDDQWNQIKHAIEV